MGVHYRSHFVLCEFLLAGSENTVRIHDKMQVVYREMTCHGAKSNEVKWNLIDGVQFYNMKNYPMFM